MSLFQKDPVTAWMVFIAKQPSKLLCLWLGWEKASIFTIFYRILKRLRRCKCSFTACKRFSSTAAVGASLDTSVDSKWSLILVMKSTINIKQESRCQVCIWCWTPIRFWNEASDLSLRGLFGRRRCISGKSCGKFAGCSLMPLSFTPSRAGDHF